MNEPIPVPGAPSVLSTDVPTDIGVPPAQPAIPAAPAVMPVAPPVYPAAAPAKTGWKGFIEGVTVTDVVIGTLVIAALSLSIYKSRKQIRHMSREYPELRADIEELKASLRPA